MRPAAEGVKSVTKNSGSGMKISYPRNSFAKYLSIMLCRDSTHVSYACRTGPASRLGYSPVFNLVHVKDVNVQSEQYLLEPGDVLHRTSGVTFIE